MNSAALTGKAKLAWADITRAEPRKRPAQARIGDFREIYALLDEATVREQATRCLQCPNPNCATGCPLSNRIPEWMALAAEGDFLGAAALSQTTSNLPEICSRVCPQERLCEGSCILNGKADPVCIGAVERFINDYALAHERVDATPAPLNGLSVAVIGSGPGGLACADELARQGYSVVVFESQQIPGGLLVNGIPSFKLEKSIVARRINILRQRGIEFRVGVTVGKDISLSELLSEFQSVFLGVGAQHAKPLDIPGAELKGVVQALPFLIEKNTPISSAAGSIDVRGKRVIVLGGGDTAMDCLRTAIRSGASEATCFYRRDFANMPGSRKEYFNALEEGARFSFLTNPVALEGKGNGEVSAVRCVKMELGERMSAAGTSRALSQAPSFPHRRIWCS